MKFFVKPFANSRDITTHVKAIQLPQSKEVSDH